MDEEGVMFLAASLLLLVAALTCLVALYGGTSLSLGVACFGAGMAFAATLSKY